MCLFRAKKSAKHFACLTRQWVTNLLRARFSETNSGKRAAIVSGSYIINPVPASRWLSDGCGGLVAVATPYLGMILPSTFMLVLGTHVAAYEVVMVCAESCPPARGMARRGIAVPRVSVNLFLLRYQRFNCPTCRDGTQT